MTEDPMGTDTTELELMRADLDSLNLQVAELDKQAKGFGLLIALATKQITADDAIAKYGNDLALPILGLLDVFKKTNKG